MLFLKFTIVVFTTETNILPHDITSFSQTFKQQEFLKDEFHYLNVPPVGISTVYDVFDCTFECLSNPLCFSVNLAASKGDDGKLWCELLSSDKYRNFTKYKGNKTSHHFSIKVRSDFKSKIVKPYITNVFFFCVKMCSDFNHN